MPPDRVKPNRLLTGATYEKSTPGCTLRVGLGFGPGTLLKSRVLSRINKYVLRLNTGFARSNALRGTIFTEPARAEPCDSGVGEYITSMRERLLIEIMSDCTARFVFRLAVACATLKPSTMMGT